MSEYFAKDDLIKDLEYLESLGCDSLPLREMKERIEYGAVEPAAEDDIIDQLMLTVATKEVIAYLKRRVCELTGLPEEEVEVKIDRDGIVHIFPRPKVEEITFELLLDGTQTPDTTTESAE